MMYSMEKCLGRNGTGTPEEADLFAGGGEGLGQEGVPSDDVVLVSAVAAVSHEIGDILKDELGDAECADRIGAELADLSAELGLLAGLADGDTQQDFPTLLKLAMGSRECESSGSSSSSWSRACARRPPRLPRRKPIGKEVSRRRSAAARRAACLRVRRVEAASDASDVGADSDSDDQWTELDASLSPSGSGSSSDTSSKSEMDEQFRADATEPPQMGQFLLPLITDAPSTVQSRIRYTDIVQLLAAGDDEPTTSDSSHVPALDKALIYDELGELPAGLLVSDELPVTTEEEAALLHYVCGGERGSMATFQPTEEWLLGMFHSWCEVSALVYTLIGSDATDGRVHWPWAYRARAGCRCRLCLCAVRAEPALACLLRDLVWALAHGGSTVPNAAHIMRALRLSGDVPLSPKEWDIPRLKRIQFSDEGAAIVHNQLVRYSQQNETARQIITFVCDCNQYTRPLEKQYAVERLIRILECYKAAAILTFKVEIVPINDDPETNQWINETREKLEEYIDRCQDSLTAAKLYDMETKYKPPAEQLRMWDEYKHRCECATPKVLCAQQRNQLLTSIYSSMSFYGLKPPATETDDSELPSGLNTDNQTANEAVQVEPAGGGLQQGDGTGAKPPDNAGDGDAAGADHVTNVGNAIGEPAGDAEPAEPDVAPASDSENEQSDANADLDDSSFLTVTDSDENFGSGSLGLSSSSLDSASELLLCAAHAVDSDTPAPTQLCRTVRHLMRSIASIERHMDTVLKQCDEWPKGGGDVEAKKQVDIGLSAVDRKLMAMYRRLPEVHKRQLQVYRKQKKLSTVCMQLVGGAAPAPPPPGTPPPAPHDLPCRALCPEYHLQRFKEVRRKVMHMRDQQLYYHRLRMWLEDQLRQERESIPDSNVTLLEDLQRRKRRTSSPRLPRLSTATKRKLKTTSLSKPHRILQLLKQKAQTTELLNDIDDESTPSETTPPEAIPPEATPAEVTSPEATPPDAFPLDRDDNISDADTIVGEEKEDLNDVIATLAKMALSPDKRVQALMAQLSVEYANARPTPTDSEEEYPEAVSPPLQEMSPTTSKPIPLYTPKPTQRLIINKFSDQIEFNAQITPELNVPLKARRTSVLVKEEVADNVHIAVYKEPKEQDSDQDGPLSLEQIIEVMMSLDKNAAEFLNKLDTDEPIDINAADKKLVELVKSMPQLLTMPEIENKLGEFANASFELASIMNSLPGVSNEAKLTQETLKQIRDLKLSKNRDSVKVTKNTAKRKICRRIKNNIGTSDVIETFTFEFDGNEVADVMKDEKEYQALMTTKLHNKEEFKDLLFSISAQVVIHKVIDYLRANSSPELSRCIESEIFALPKKRINAETYARVAVLFESSLKDILSMCELRDSIRSRFYTWRMDIAVKFKSIPLVLLDTEIEAMLDTFYVYVKDLASKKKMCGRERKMKSLEICRKEQGHFDSGDESPPKESIKQITKILNVSVGNTFDLLLMKMSRMSGEKRAALKSMRIRYVDVLKRCAESQQLGGWILSDPDRAASHIQELMGFGLRKQQRTPNFAAMSAERKRVYFMDRLKAINMHFMDNIPRKSVTGEEWLVMLYRLEQFENKIRDALVKYSPPTKRQKPSEGEILAAKGLSKIIEKANNMKVVKKPEPVREAVPAPAPAPPAPAPIALPAPAPALAPKDKPDPTKPMHCTPNTRRKVIMKCETLIAQKGNKTLKDSFDVIKSFLAGEVAKPDNYNDHVMTVITNIDYSALDDEMVEVLQFGGIKSPPVPNETAKVNLPAQDPAALTKYSALALSQAKEALEAAAFKNLSRNGQSKSESDISSCDVPSSECKYTSDCVCTACKRDRTLCVGDIVKVTIDSPNQDKGKGSLDERKKEVKEMRVVKVPAKSKPVPKQCENATHQQHVCKVGHTNNGNGSCTGDAGDQHCTCCYCAVFGHAPPLTTPVPRNFNETRERLRSILNKKKQLCKTANAEQNLQQDNKSPQPEKKPAVAQAQVNAVSQTTPPPLKVVQPQPKPPALPKTLPPNLTAQAQAKRQALDNQQRMLADKMAKMVVTEKPEIKPVALQRTVPVQVNVSPSLKAEGMVNPNAMEQIRLQQLKQQQAQFQQQMAQQKKPEPIYDLPIHNKPPLQQQQIRQELHKQQLQKQLYLQQQVKPNPVVQTSAQAAPNTPLLLQQLQHTTAQLQQIQLKPTAQPIQQKTVQQIPPKPTTQPPVQQKPALVHVQQIPVQQLQQKPVQQQVQQKAAQQQVQQKPVQQQVQQKPMQQQIPQKLTPVHVLNPMPQTVNRLVANQAQNTAPQQLQKLTQPQLLQKPPVQQAPRKPPPQELQQKLALKQQQQQPLQHKSAQTQSQPVQPKPAVQTQLTPAQLQQQQLQQQQLRHQQQLQQQQAQQQQGQSRQANQNNTTSNGSSEVPAQQTPTPLQQQNLLQQRQLKQQLQQQQLLQRQQLEQTLQQQQQKTQQQQQQRQGRQTNLNSVSLSSRDTSVFSTSSGCSDGSCWQGRAEDTRDLDALLQYIEGPSRHVDRGKKKAKKQRQKAKKTEERLCAESAELKIEYSRVRLEAEALRVAHYSAKRRCEETRKALQVLTAQNASTKSRKKQNKLNPVQKQQIQVLAEKVGELSALMNTTAKELQTAENHVTECSQKLIKCEKEITEARSMQGKKTALQAAQDAAKRGPLQKEEIQEKLLEQKQMLQQDKLKLQLQMYQIQQQRQLQAEQEAANKTRTDEAKQLKQRQNEAIAKADRLKGNGVRSSSLSASSTGSVSSTGADRGASSPASASSAGGGSGGGAAVQTPLRQLINNNRHIIIAKHVEENNEDVPSQAKTDAPRKQTPTWEQALANINQAAKGAKDKKKQEVPSSPVKSAEVKPKSAEVKTKPAEVKPKPAEVKPKPAEVKPKPAEVKPKPAEVKPKSAEVKPKPAEVKPKPAEVEAPALSKKQKKKLAQQQAEEEEKRLQEQLQKQEAKNKKAKKETATPEVKAEPLTKKAEKKLEQAKRAEQAKSKKEAKRERKLEKKAEKKEEKKAKEKEAKDTKEKENKPEKNAQYTSKQAKPVPPPAPAPAPPQNPPPLAQTKKERKKEQQKQQDQKPEKPHVVNITPHTTIEVVNKKNVSAVEQDKPASCSIMEQLSCGIQVSELRLPPGITLTRVHPNEKKEPHPIKSVPLWKANQLSVAPTPVARPVPVINADPSMMAFHTAHPEQAPKPIIVAELPQASSKSKKTKKKNKKTGAVEDSKPEGTKMVTLRNPMFHPNLPSVQITNSPPVQVTNPKKPEIRLPDPIPMPPNACQATITPTSNGMYTIRNPLMSMMHQQSMGVRNPTPPFNQQYNYTNPNTYNQQGVPPGGQYVNDPTQNAAKPDEYQSRIMNLASFTQKNDEGYSLFKTSDHPQRSFLTPEYYGDESAPKPVVSPNPIGTRPEVNRYESDTSLFANPIQRPEPIGTPLKREEERNEYTGLYTPFGVENPNVFRNALFNDRTDVGKFDEMSHLANGDLPYFQRLRVGSKLNNEVTIHHVTESKFYRQEPPMQPLDETPADDSLFSRSAHGWPDPMYPATAVISQAPPRPAGPPAPAPAPEPRFGAVGTRPHKDNNETSVFVPDPTISNLSSLEACEREIESFKRFEWYFSPPEHKPKVQLHVSEIANSMKK